MSVTTGAAGQPSGHGPTDATRFLAALVASSRDVILGLTLDGIVRTWNAGAEKVYGYTADEAVGRHISFLTPADRGEEIPDIFERLRRGEFVERYRTERVRKDGTYVHVAITFSPVNDASGVVIGASAIHRDVSGTVRAALALQASEARFRSVVASAAEGIVVANQAGEIILWNPGASRIFGYDMTETLGRSLAMIMPERLHEAHRRAVAAAARPGPTVHRKPIEVVGQRKDGSEIPIEVSLTSWESDGERYVTGLVRDISERRAIERMKDTFIAMVSHELRTPLNTITCSLDLLSSGALGTLTDKASRLVEIAQSNTDRLSRIVGDILELQVLDQGRVPLVRERCDLAAVVVDAVQTTAPMAERRSVGIDRAVTLPPDLPLYADAGRLHQTLVNLLVNATRYAPAGSRIVVNAWATGGEVRLMVDDEGPGIPPTERELVFERFYQAAPPSDGQAPGTGLGLAICRAIVQQHGGRIWVEDGPRGGAAIVVSLPARP